MKTIAPTSIRPARVADVTVFGKIINDCAEYGLMLHRSLAFLYEHVREFHVAEVEDTGQISGVCGLRIVWANIAEIYALAIAPDHRGKGLGRQLVEACVQDARRLGVAKLMSLTYERHFFEVLGFHVVDRQQLPLKVWSECLRCSKTQACDEIAMIRDLPDVPVVALPEPISPPADQYVVPMVDRAPLRAETDERREKMDEAKG